MKLTVFSAHHCRANSTQETLVIKIGPGTALTYRTETIAICPHCIRIEIGNSEIVQHLESIVSAPDPGALPKSPAACNDSRLTTPTVGSPKEIVVDMHGTFVAWSAWNMNSHHHPIIRFKHFNFRFDGQHGAHLGPIADRVPKI